MPETWEPSRKPALTTISPWSSLQSLGVSLFACGQGAPASQNYVAVGVAVFIPFWVPVSILIRKMGWGNGAAVAGNIDVGIYKTDGTLLVSSGSTAQSGTSTLQVVTVADTFLPRGQYYFAMDSDTSGATQKVIAVLPAAGIPQALGLLEMTAAVPLATNASPATFAKYARAFVPLVMAQGYRTVGP
jgi:hypothetical protein